MNKKIKLGKYTIHVSIINGVRMVKYSDVIELLKLNGKDVTKNYVEANIITDVLYHNIYVKKISNKEQEIIYNALCIVGLFPLIDEVCNVDLKTISYIKEFNKLISNSN